VVEAALVAPQHRGHLVERAQRRVELVLVVLHDAGELRGQLLGAGQQRVDREPPALDLAEQQVAVAEQRLEVAVLRGEGGGDLAGAGQQLGELGVP
jgi:hypothetical protein